VKCADKGRAEEVKVREQEGVTEGVGVTGEVKKKETRRSDQGGKVNKKEKWKNLVTILIAQKKKRKKKKKNKAVT